MVKKCCLSLALVIGFLTSHAQGDFRRGYVILNNGDSINGFVEHRSKSVNSRICFFKTGKREPRVEYTPAQLNAYAILDDRRYESISPGDGNGGAKSLFAETLIRGRMSLYRNGDVFYIDVNGRTYELPRKGYTDILNRFVQECSLSANLTYYSESAFSNLVQNYNRCKGGEGVPFEVRKADTHLNYQVFAGTDKSSMEVKSHNDVFSPVTSYFIGAGIDFSSPRLSDKTFLSIEAIYQKKNFRGYIENQSGPVTERTFMYFDFALLKIPIGLRYNFMEEASTPYVKLGVVQLFKLDASFDLLREKENGGIVDSDYTTYDVERNLTGVWASAGYSHMLVGKVKGFLEFRYEKTGGIVGRVDNYSFSGITTINIILGARF